MMEILYFVSVLIFLVYIIIILTKFGVPKSISDSSYLFGKNGNTIFYLVFISFIVPLLIYWLEITEGDDNQFMVFISCAALCFTGITGRFKDTEQQNNVHTYATVIAAILSQIWMWVVIPGSWKWGLTVFPLAILAGYAIEGTYRLPGTKSHNGKIALYKNSILFWVEIALFALVYYSIFVYGKIE